MGGKGRHPFTLKTMACQILFSITDVIVASSKHIYPGLKIFMIHIGDLAIHKTMLII